MPATHTVLAPATPGGPELDQLLDAEGESRLIVSRLGAEPISLARRVPPDEWRGFLHRDGDATAPADGGWASHATVMGYYLHRLKGGRTSYRGREIKDGNHGFLRRKVFGAPRFNEEMASLTYSIAPPDFTPAEYPLNVALDLSYGLFMPGALRVQFDFTNRDPSQTAHVSFGLHPGFAVGSLERASIRLSEGHYRHHLAPGDFLSGEVREFDQAFGEAPIDKAALPSSYLLEVPAGGMNYCTLDDPVGGRSLQVVMEEFPYLTLWSDGRGQFVCIEPCWGLPDHHEQRPFEAKLGIQSIEPGGTFSASFGIMFEAIDKQAAA